MAAMYFEKAFYSAREGAVRKLLETLSIVEHQSPEHFEAFINSRLADQPHFDTILTTAIACNQAEVVYQLLQIKQLDVTQLVFGHPALHWARPEAGVNPVIRVLLSHKLAGTIDTVMYVSKTGELYTFGGHWTPEAPALLPGTVTRFIPQKPPREWPIQYVLFQPLLPVTLQERLFHLMRIKTISVDAAPKSTAVETLHVVKPVFSGHKRREDSFSAHAEIPPFAQRALSVCNKQDLQLIVIANPKATLEHVVLQHDTKSLGIVLLHCLLGLGQLLSVGLSHGAICPENVHLRQGSEISAQLSGAWLETRLGECKDQFWSPERKAAQEVHAARVLLLTEDLVLCRMQRRPSQTDDIWALGWTILYAGTGLCEWLAPEYVGHGSPYSKKYQIGRGEQLLQEFQAAHGIVFAGIVSKMITPSFVERANQELLLFEVGEMLTMQCAAGATCG